MRKKEGKVIGDKREDNEETEDELSVSSKGSDESQSDFDESELYDERLTSAAISDSVNLQNAYDKEATDSNMHLIQNELTNSQEYAFNDWHEVIPGAEWKELDNKKKSYEELAYFDKRSEEEKCDKWHGKRLCQTQLFFSDKRDVKEKDPDNAISVGLWEQEQGQMLVTERRED